MEAQHRVMSGVRVMADADQPDDTKRKPYRISREEARALVEAGYMPLADYLDMFGEDDAADKRPAS
jgi:hypothetical protein